MDNNELEPKILWGIFKEILSVPRPSGKTDLIRSWLIEFAKSHNLDWKKDKTGNVLIRKPASSGYEKSDPVILQAHMDMVCEKNGDIEHDFFNDPIESYIEDGWMKARGTTLGADDGIGMAAALSVLAGENLLHPELECLFTVDEETGLVGAVNIAPHFFKSGRMINLDSEDDGQLFIGCAGGITNIVSFKYEDEAAPAGYYFCEVIVSGLAGGHSGEDINKGRGNANQLLARYLYNESKKTDLRLVSFTGGNLSNAIPREASCMIAVPGDFKEQLRMDLNFLYADISDELKYSDKNFKLEMSSVKASEKVLVKDYSEKFVNSLYACPNAVISMSGSVPGLVETSLNVASVKKSGEKEWKIAMLLRSSLESAKKSLSDRIIALFSLAGMKVECKEDYPGWSPNPDSPILNVVELTYMKLFGKKPEIKAIHAGLECGLFLDKYPNLDMVSFGPTMRGVHSPDERLEIATVMPFWKLLTETLKNLK